MKRYIKAIILIVFLIIIYLYIANICLMPKSITLLQGDKLELASLWGINLKPKSLINYNINTEQADEALETASILNDRKIEQVRKSRNGSKYI